MIIAEIDSALGRRKFIKVFDCGSGQGLLLNALKQSRLDLRRIEYMGIDLDGRSVDEINHRKLKGEFECFRRVDARKRDLTDLSGYTAGSFDLIVACNVVHEVPPRNYGSFFGGLNNLLVRNGKFCIVDMEELPAEVFEPSAISWTADEMRCLLLTMGFHPRISHHQKSVAVYRAVTHKTFSFVQNTELRRALLHLLRRKRNTLLESNGLFRYTTVNSKFASRPAFAEFAISKAIRELELS